MKIEHNRGKIILKMGIVVVVMLGIAGYCYHQSSRLIDGPQITIISPINGSSSSSPLTEIVGVAKNISKITLNDRQIFIDDDGNFSERLLLSDGYNILKVDAQDKFGKKTEKQIEVVRI